MTEYTGKLAVVPPDDLDRLRRKGLEILLYFKEICEKNDLKFYFCGGCCIGAIRHKGFIPWDDDVDVFMPRDDYEKLRDIWNEQADTERYSYVRTDEHDFTRLLFAMISDNDTTFIKTRQWDLDTNHGVRIDILPLDGCPNSRFKRKMQIMWALVYSMFMTREPHESKGKALKIISKVMLALAITDKNRYRIAKFAERKMSKYKIEDCDKITELCAWYQYMVNEYPKSAFESQLYVDFEGYKLPIPVGYDDYLKMAFGDYMQLPPKDKQVAKHDLVYYNLEEGYKKFKGKYYCVKDGNK